MNVQLQALLPGHIAPATYSLHIMQIANFTKPARAFVPSHFSTFLSNEVSQFLWPNRWKCCKSSL